MPRSMAQEQDVLKRATPKRPPCLTSRRIGIHTSTAGGVQNAAERAYRLGCNTLQIFSSSPRRWAPYELGEPQCAEMNRLRAKYDLKPLVIHTNYLINLASSNQRFLQMSLEAFRGEVVRALSLCADYLVLHPGSFRGADREQGLLRTAAAIAASTQGLDLAKGGLTILIENTAGAEFSLGGSFDQVAEVLERLEGMVPVGACIDTCHTHVAGYDIVSEEGFNQTLQHLDNTIGLSQVKVWHCNDAKAARGSKLDRHQHVGKGMIGNEAFRQLLNDPRTAHAAFIAETPIDKPGDDRRNVDALKKLVVRDVACLSLPESGNRRRGERDVCKQRLYRRYSFPMKLYRRFDIGQRGKKLRRAHFAVEHDDRFYEIHASSWDEIVARENLFEHLYHLVDRATQIPAPLDLLPPISSQEVWAAGVTYFRSRDARMEESKSAGGGDFYDRVYSADRPELFFKATPHRVVGPGGKVAIRSDASWSVPEPELVLFVTPGGKIAGYTIGNDMSSRDIEGENPLYLPQAKVYDRSCALGPCLLVSEEPLPASTEIKIDIRRQGKTVFSGATTLKEMKRSPEELVRYLYHSASFPFGCFLFTGTGIVPPDSFTLKSQDEIHIAIPPIGALVNQVD